MRFAGSQADRKVKAEADAKKIAEQLKSTNITGSKTHSPCCMKLHLFLKLR